MRVCMDEDDIVLYKVDSVVDHKIQNNRLYYKIRWADWSQEYDSWEEESTLKSIRPLIDSYKQKNGLQGELQLKNKKIEEEEKESVILKKKQKNDMSYGHFKYGDIPEKVKLIEISKNSKTQKNELNCIVEWKERVSGDKPKCSVFSNNHLRKKAPDVLIDYYESKIILMSEKFMNKDQASLYWNQQSKNYIKFNEPISQQNFNMAIQTTFQTLEKNKKLKILDVGCGSGLLIEDIMINYFDCIEEITINDISYNMINKATKRLKKFNNVKVIIHNNDIKDFVYEYKYDIIIAGLILHLIPDSQKQFERMCNNLNINGILIISIYKNPKLIEIFPEIQLLQFQKQVKKELDNFKYNNISKIIQNCSLKNILKYQTTIYLPYYQKLRKIFKDFQKSRSKDLTQQKKSKDQIIEMLQKINEREIAIIMDYYVLSKEIQI